MTDHPSRSAGDRPGAVEILARSTVYQGFFALHRIRLRHRLFAGGWSAPLTRELFVRGPAVGVLLYDPRHRLVGLVEQFRIGALEEPAGPWVIEMVAGMVEEGEDARAVARREVAEEAGIHDLVLEPICRYLTSPGGSDETHTLFCGLTDLRDRAGHFGLAHEHEDIRLLVMPEAEALAGLAAGRYNNAATIVCLQWLALHGARLREGRGQCADQSTDRAPGN
ncbi:MAG: NUDIX domain-containing protein [Pseudomonadota bacterium]|jgi:ADP-ribose pyrophosphatase